jgi:transposase-like protein
VFVSRQRDGRATRRFFEQAIGTTKITPAEIVTDKALTYPAVVGELLATAWHCTDRYANNHIKSDHGRLKSRLRLCEDQAGSQRQGDHCRPCGRSRP